MNWKIKSVFQDDGCMHAVMKLRQDLRLFCILKYTCTVHLNCFFFNLVPMPKRFPYTSLMIELLQYSPFPASGGAEYPGAKEDTDLEVINTRLIRRQ